MLQLQLRAAEAQRGYLEARADADLLLNENRRLRSQVWPSSVAADWGFRCVERDSEMEVSIFRHNSKVRIRVPGSRSSKRPPCGTLNGVGAMPFAGAVSDHPLRGTKLFVFVFLAPAPWGLTRRHHIAFILGK